MTSAADAAAAGAFDSAAAAVAAADVFGARGDSAAAADAGKPHIMAHAMSADVAAVSTENGSAATCCRLPSPPADGDECMSPANSAPVGVASGLEPLTQLCYQSAPPPPLAALAQPEEQSWCELSCPRLRIPAFSATVITLRLQFGVCCFAEHCQRLCT